MSKGNWSGFPFANKNRIQALGAGEKKPEREERCSRQAVVGESVGVTTSEPRVVAGK